MVSVAVIEDNVQDREVIKSYLDRYAKQNGESFKISEFDNAIVFLTNYKPIYDVVFADIQMPHMDGMKAAVKLRAMDAFVPLVFITNMSSYAVQGYSVNAVDFVVKPITYYNFEAMLKKVLRISESRFQEVILKVADGGRRLFAHDIIYVEVIDHKVIYHTEKEDIEIWETLKAQESKLAGYGFAYCNNYCLVNLKHVDNISGGTVTVKGTELTVTRSKKKEFMRKLVDYYGKNI